MIDDDDDNKDVNKDADDDYDEKDERTKSVAIDFSWTKGLKSIVIGLWMQMSIILRLFNFRSNCDQICHPNLFSPKKKEKEKKINFN